MNPRVLDANWEEARRLHPGKLNLNEELYALSRAGMTLPPGETLDMHEWVEIIVPSGSAGLYRVSTVTTDMRTGVTDVKCEHAICTMGDSVAQAESQDLSGTAATVLGTVLGYQKTAMWALGQCDYSGNVSVNVNYNTVLSLYTNVIEQLNGYHPEYDFSVRPWLINIRENAAAPGIEGRLGRNVASAKVSYDDRDLCNVCYCKQLSSNPMVDAQSVARWGRREGHMDLDEGATAAMALTAAQMWLDKRKDPAISVSIDTADLSAVTGESIDQIRLGKTYRLAVPKYNAVVDECVVSVAWSDLVASPLKAQVTLANHAADLTLHIRKAKGGGGGGGGGGAKNKLAAAIKQYETQFVKTDQYIALIATDTDVQTAQLQGKSLFQITSKDITSVVAQAGVSTSDTFDPTQSYAAGATVVYGGALYRFTAAHTGPWTGTDVTQITLQSQISQNAQSIDLAVGDISQLKIDVNGITIQGDVITIKGNHIDMGDYVTIANLQANYATITALDSATARISAIEGGTAHLSGVICDGNISAVGGVSASGVYVGTTDLSTAIVTIGTASESGGQITIPTTRLNGNPGTPINFNIAATNYFQTEVAAAEARGEAKFAQATVTPQGASETVYVPDNTGTIYYTAGMAVYKRGTQIERKTTGYLYDANGDPVGYGAWFVDSVMSTQYLYRSGDQVTPINSGNYIRVKSGTRYVAGTPDSTTYYTRVQS